VRSSKDSLSGVVAGTITRSSQSDCSEEYSWSPSTSTPTYCCHGCGDARLSAKVIIPVDEGDIGLVPEGLPREWKRLVGGVV